MNTITPEQFAEFETLYGQGRIMVLQAGEGAEHIEFAAKRITAVKDNNGDSEWEIFLAFRAKNDDSVAENMLRRAVVGCPADQTTAERTRLTAELEADPQLGDVWGYNLIAATGWEAPVKKEGLDSSGRTLLVATVEGQDFRVAAEPLRGAKWRQVRRATSAGKSREEIATLCFELSTGLKASAYELRPGLPIAFGFACSMLGTKAGTAGPKSYPG